MKTVSDASQSPGNSGYGQSSDPAELDATAAAIYSSMDASPRALSSPANAEAAQLYRENMKEYIRRVKATVEESWLDPEEKERVEEDVRADAEAEGQM